MAISCNFPILGVLNSLNIRFFWLNDVKWLWSPKKVMPNMDEIRGVRCFFWWSGWAVGHAGDNIYKIWIPKLQRSNDEGIWNGLSLSHEKQRYPEIKRLARRLKLWACSFELHLSGVCLNMMKIGWTPEFRTVSEYFRSHMVHGVHTGWNR